MQENVFEPFLRKAYAIICRSDLGNREKYDIVFNPLSVPTEAEQAATQGAKSSYYGNLINAGVVSPEEVRQALRQDENSGFTDIAEDLPEDTGGGMGGMPGNENGGQPPNGNNGGNEESHPSGKNQQDIFYHGQFHKYAISEEELKKYNRPVPTPEVKAQDSANNESNENWKTLYPNGKSSKGQKVKLNEEKEIEAGLGGEHNGETLQELVEENGKPEEKKEEGEKEKQKEAEKEKKEEIKTESAAEKQEQPKENKNENTVEKGEEKQEQAEKGNESKEITPENIREIAKEKLKGAKAVATISGKEFAGETIEERRNVAKKYFNTLRGKPYFNKSLGKEIKILGGKKTFSQSGYDSKINSIKYLPEILENSVYIGSAPETKGRTHIKEHHYFACYLNIDNTNELCLITARETRDGNVYYNHNIDDFPINETTVQDTGTVIQYGLPCTANRIITQDYKKNKVLLFGESFFS